MVDDHGTTITSCECKSPGFCKRHGVDKPEAWWLLCQRRRDYFGLWEQGRGPGQRMPDLDNPKAPKELPPLRDQAISFIKAFAEWAGDCFRCVGQEEFDRRVEICMACPDDLFIRRRGRCRECGCWGNLKARGRVWMCPKGHWERVNV